MSHGIALTLCLLHEIIHAFIHALSTATPPTLRVAVRALGAA